MNRRRCALIISVALAVSSASQAQAPPPRDPLKDNYSEEAAVIEEMSTKIAFDNDGNLTRQQTTRVRVRTDAGVQQWGLLSISFQSATQTVEIDYVRVRKPDGSILNTPPDNIQDIDSAVTRNAPFYSDLREKHIAVKNLGKGDILEYQAHWLPIKPLVPGQFWLEYNFQHDAIVLDERLDIKVPADRTVKVKGPQSTQVVTTEPGFRTYSWTSSSLKIVKSTESDQKKAIEAARGLLPPPDVQVSSFQTWEEVGNWYWNLQKERTQPSPAIRAKAVELTAGLKDDQAKLRAIYNFVSLHYRYIGISFGIGRYQPHAADDVLTNNYGDCKDKHTLLASLSQAAGIALYPALISSSRQLDPDIPSPAQFDHVIGYLPQSQTAVWLDTTPEVAPFGYLSTLLRDKQALVMMGDKSGQLTKTPIDPPMRGTQTFKIDAKLSPDGSLDAKVEDSLLGDREVPARSAFRQMPQSQWKDLVQQISYALGFAGTVSDITASVPEVTAQPFRFSYSYHRKDYPDWGNHQFSVPSLPFYMPTLRDDAAYPIFLGSPSESVSDAKVELPAGFKPQLPENVDLKYDFAEYHASYSQDQGVLIAERRLLTKQHEVPVAEFDDYKNFVKKVQDDLSRYVQTSSASAVLSVAPTMSGLAPFFLGGLWDLPQSDLSEANRLEISARSSLDQRDPFSAVSNFEKVVQADPKFTRAWIELAVVYMSLRQSDSALGALRKAIESDPKQILAHKAYASALARQHRPEAAMDAWRETLKIASDDPDANSGMGLSLMQQKRYSESLPYLDAAAKIDNSPSTQNSLGWAYLKAGQTEKATVTFEKVVASDPKPETFNNIGYELADANVALPKALEYAQQAVDKQEKESFDIKLDALLPEDLKCTQKISRYWDTLGWVHFRLGHLNQAESYIRASWLLAQAAVVGDHLGQIYEQQGKKREAIHMYRLALAALGATSVGDERDEIQRHIEHLTDTKAPRSPREISADPSAGELSQIRSAKLRRLVPGTASAEFFLLFGPGPKVEDLQFISGSPKLKDADDALSEAKFQVAFPQASGARLVRRAILSCSAVTGCEAVLLNPDSVNSLR